MTNTTENQEKQKPAFYIFAKDAEGKSQHIGAAFHHAKGNGFNILIGKQRFVAFPPKVKAEPGESA